MKYDLLQYSYNLQFANTNVKIVKSIPKTTTTMTINKSQKTGDVNIMYPIPVNSAPMGKNFQM